MIAEARNPRNAQLCGRYSFAFGNLRETAKDLVLGILPKFNHLNANQNTNPSPPGIRGREVFVPRIRSVLSQNHVQAASVPPL